MVGGPFLGAVIGRWRAAFECGVLALVLASCGGSDPEPQPAPEPRRSETPAQLEAEPGEGDEQPILVPIGIRVTGSLTGIEPNRVSAFLPLRFEVSNDRGRRAVVRVDGVGRVEIEPGRRAVLRSPGLRPGRYRVRGPAQTRTLRVVRG